MNALCFIKYLVLHFMCIHCSYSQGQYYITSSDYNSCSRNACITLSQFVAMFDSNRNGCHGTESNVSLIFLPGNHSLNKELSLAHISNFSMTKIAQNNEAVIIECFLKLGHFNINDTVFVSIRGLHFIGCGGNSITLVEELEVEDSIFQGVEGRGTALKLKDIASTIIVRSFFLSNSHSISVNKIVKLFSGIPKNDLLYAHTIACLERNASLATSGALHVVFSNVSIDRCGFIQNRAEIGGAIVAEHSIVYIANTTYNYNKAVLSGVMVTCESIVNINNTTFSGNTAELIGGVLMTYRDLISISSTVVTDNTASTSHAGAISSYESLLSITKSTFNANVAKQFCGAICSIGSSFGIATTSFASNRAIRWGGFLEKLNSGESSFTVTDSIFSNNNAHNCGVMSTLGNSSFNIINSTFTNNSASMDGGVMMTSENSSFNMINSTFTNNSATRFGGVMIVAIKSFTVVTNCKFKWNYGETGGVLYATQCDIVLDNCSFDYNFGVLHAFSSNITLSGYTSIKNTAKPSHETTLEAEVIGRAITSFQSTITIKGVCHLLNNTVTAHHGGLILGVESTITIHGEATIANNMAKGNDGAGGGISLLQSSLDVKGKCNISNNCAVRGGGIHATSSTIRVHQPGVLQLINNYAKNGSGIYLEVNPKVYILIKSETANGLLIFTGNQAEYGGAMYVDDFANCGACLRNEECFIQSLALYQYYNHHLNNNNIEHVHFSGNTATEQGSDVFGGLLDRCISSKLAEVHKNQWYPKSGFAYLTSISNVSIESISSLPVRICFCNKEGEPDCSYQCPSIKVKKGETFTVSLVAVDQVNHTKPASIISSLSSNKGGLYEGQQIQSVDTNCTNLTFNVFSPHDYETINLYADGPCGSARHPTSKVTVHFLNCTCPVGFEPHSTNKSATKCECTCDSRLSPYITSCNSTTSSLVRVNTNSWITYVNDTDPPGFMIHPNCPFDYCKPPNLNFSFNLNLPNGADSQCAYNRRGMLCGACQHELSLSLGTSHCMSCHNHQPTMLFIILMAAIIAGILLVTVMLVLNITVAVGLVNGYIFYANIVAVNSALFFPSSQPGFPTVFVAWLNLDIGLDVCLFDGLDTYTKAWLQLAFPIYIISLVVVIITVSECSSRFATLIGKKDPVATLATLILLSYAKLLSGTIAALSFAVIHYPDGSQETVWLPDGNVKYFQGKHIPLFLVALLIIIIGLPYTVSLFLWQWLVCAPWKIFKWTRNSKLITFISTYHAPYNSKHRYWTGLLLLVRVVLYAISSVTMSSNPQLSPVMTITLVAGLFLLRVIVGLRVCRRPLVDIVNTVLYLNLLTLATFSLYDFKADNWKQMAAAYSSTLTTFILVIGLIIYHISLLNKGNQSPDELNRYHLVIDPPPRVTHSSIELPKCYQNSPLKTNSYDLEAMEDYRKITQPEEL